MTARIGAARAGRTPRLRLPRLPRRPWQESADTGPVASRARAGGDGPGEPASRPTRKAPKRKPGGEPGTEGGPGEALASGGPRLTASGWAVLAASVALLGAGWAAGHPEPTALGAAGIGAVAASLAATVPRPSLSAERRLSPPRVARGDSAGGVVSVTNLGARPCRGLVVEDHCDGAVVSVRLPVLPAHGTARADYAVPTNRRGNVLVGPLRLVRRDPFGLARRTIPIGAAAMLLVHPRVHPVQLPPSGRDHNLEGPTSDTANEGTMTFHALREYVEGDDLRRVHWRATARTGNLMVRQMADVSLPVTTLLLDTRPGAYTGADPDADFELAVDVAASVGHAATSRNFPLRVCTGSRGPVEYARSTAARLVGSAALLAHLSAIGRDDEAFGRALDQLRHVGSGGTLVMVTGWGDRDIARRIAGAARRHERAVVVRVGTPPAGEVHASASLTVAGVTRLPDVAGLWTTGTRH